MPKSAAAPPARREIKVVVHDGGRVYNQFVPADDYGAFGVHPEVGGGPGWAVTNTRLGLTAGVVPARETAGRLAILLSALPGWESLTNPAARWESHGRLLARAKAVSAAAVRGDWAAAYSAAKGTV